MNPRSNKEELEEQLSQIKIGNKPGLSLEGLRLLVEVEKERQAANGIDFNCYVMESRDLSSFLQHLSEMELSDQPVKMQLIVKCGGHYTTIDFKLSAEGNECMIFDAAGDPRYYSYLQKLENLKDPDGKIFFNRVYVGCARGAAETNRMQKDYHSCPIFSFDHARQAAAMDDLYKYLAREFPSQKEEQMVSAFWDKMPPQFVWNTQSMSWLKDYAKKYPNEVSRDIYGVGMSFSDYVDAGKKTVSIEGCDLLTRSTPPTLKDISKLKIKSNAAYILSEDKLFYVNKFKNECIEIQLSKEALEMFKAEMQPSKDVRVLSNIDLKKIKYFTGHTADGPILKDVNSSAERIFAECQISGMNYIEDKDEGALGRIVKYNTVETVFEHAPKREKEVSLMDKLNAIVNSSELWEEKIGKKFPAKDLKRVLMIDDEQSAMDKFIKLSTNKSKASFLKLFSTMKQPFLNKELKEFYKMASLLNTDNDRVARNYFDNLYKQVQLNNIVEQIKPKKGN